LLSYKWEANKPLSYFFGTSAGRYGILVVGTVSLLGWMDRDWYLSIGKEARFLFSFLNFQTKRKANRTLSIFVFLIYIARTVTSHIYTSYNIFSIFTQFPNHPKISTPSQQKCSQPPSSPPSPSSSPSPPPWHNHPSTT